MHTSLLTKLRRAKKLSERELASAVHLARETIRNCERDLYRAKIEHLESIARHLESQVLLAVVPNTPAKSECSTVALSLAVQRDGFDSWKIHFMDLVDEFRRSSDLRLLILPPIGELDERLRAMLASIVCALCNESELEPPEWAQREYFLPRPWFVAGVESLKASALVEAAPEFRRNNIFVQENFLQRV